MGWILGAYLPVLLSHLSYVDVPFSFEPIEAEMAVGDD